MTARPLILATAVLAVCAAPAAAAPTPVTPADDAALTGESADGKGRVEVYATFEAASAGPSRDEPVVTLEIDRLTGDESERIAQLPMYKVSGGSGPRGTYRANVRLELAPGRYEWDVEDSEGSFVQVHEFTVAGPVAPAVPDPAAALPPATRAVLTPHGVFGIRRGMTVRRARRASRQSVRRLRSGGGSPSCGYAELRRRRLSFLLNRGRVVRFSTAPRSRVAALGGIVVGDTEAKVREVFGAAVRTSDHAYSSPGQYLDVRFHAGRYQGRMLRFATDPEGRVTTILAGSPNYVRRLEGCS